jgi:hypothetical protein
MFHDNCVYILRNVTKKPYILLYKPQLKYYINTQGFAVKNLHLNLHLQLH